jgi:hypothetical protein
VCLYPLHISDSQRLGKRVPTATNTYVTIEELLDAVFYMRSVSYVVNGGRPTSRGWGRGSNTSTVALRVVGCDEKGTQCLGV